SVWTSSRPTGLTPRRSRPGRRSSTVSRPSGSETVVTNPFGLFNRKYVFGPMSSRMRRSSTLIEAATGSARSPRLASFPLTRTRPSRIHSSAARREARPLVAMIFWIRTSARSALRERLVGLVRIGLDADLGRTGGRRRDLAGLDRCGEVGVGVFGARQLGAGVPPEAAQDIRRGPVEEPRAHHPTSSPHLLVILFQD